MTYLCRTIPDVERIPVKLKFVNYKRSDMSLMLSAGLRQWSLAKKMLYLYYALVHRATPWYARGVAALSLLYLFSPVDVIPDIIPFAGYLDDLVVVPLLLNAAGRLVPPAVKTIAAQKSERNFRRLRWMMIGLVVLIVLLITACSLLLISLIQHLFT